MTFYRASWSKLLIFFTVLGSLIFLVPVILIFTAVLPHDTYPVWFAELGIILFILAALFMIRGYSLTPDFILIHRLLWSTRISRKNIQWAKREQGVGNWSIRVFGNGGFFSFTGFFWNKKNGFYRAFLTDLDNCIIIRFTARTIVISPDQSEAFLKELSVPGPTG